MVGSDFARLWKAPVLDMDAVERWLDEATAVARLDAIRGIPFWQMGRLWRAAEGRGTVDLEFFVPPGKGTLEEVIHDGVNSLPVFRSFQKRFCRQPGGEALLGGYNHQATSAFTGPGYFVARATKDGVDIDYRALPEAKAPGWPEIVPQDVRLGRFVYAGMVDVMRRVSKHVSVGRAIRGGKPSENYFVLVRRDSWP